MFSSYSCLELSLCLENIFIDNAYCYIVYDMAEFLVFEHLHSLIKCLNYQEVIKYLTIKSIFRYIL